MALTRWAWTTLAVLLTVACGCKLLDSTCDESDPECLGRDVRGLPNGSSCERSVQCAAGLLCREDLCRPSEDKVEGAACARTGECEAGFYCAASRTCEAAGSGVQGDVCEDSSDCERGLRCDLSARGLPMECVPGGERDINQPCGDGCMAGLACLPVTDPPTCQNPPAQDREIPTIPTWDGTDCADETEDAVAYFAVPRTGQDDEFYRLPFPNDIRLKSDGTVDLGSHPRPPTTPIPMAANFLAAADGSLQGFSTNPVIYFRFSRSLDFARSVRAEGARVLVDITPDSPDYDRVEKPEAWPASDSNYICGNWLALQRPVGRPLRPETTYAAIVSRQVSPEAGGSFERDPDFAAMLASDAPSDSTMLRAYEAFKPLRDWIQDTDFDADSILVATVFTTMAPEQPVSDIAELIEDRQAPTVKDLTVCGDGVTSPCETMGMEDGQATVRGSCADGSGFTEIHGRITLPMFQEGTLPYEETGGNLATGNDGAPQVTGTEDVCFALAVPDGDAPAGGWPVLVYGHGTGGSFAGTMGAGGLAEELAGADTPSATLAIDLPQHGDRRGDSDLSPEVLFFNVLNPAAARGNVIQGSADLLSLVAFAKRGEIDAAASPTDQAIRFDADRIAVMGHSQGATHAALMLPYAPDLAAGVLSGVGGHLASSLARKSQPFDIASVLGIALFDPRGTSTDLAAERRNPTLAIMQWFNDAADPINFAWRIHEEPTDVVPTGLHMMMTYGTSDSFSPGTTQVAYARAGRFPLVGNGLSDPAVEGDSADPQLFTALATAVPAPAMDTVTVGGVSRSVGVRQFTPTAGEDGHFVAVRPGQAGRGEVVNFLQAALSGTTPSIGE